MSVTLSKVNPLKNSRIAIRPNYSIIKCVHLNAKFRIKIADCHTWKWAEDLARRHVGRIMIDKGTESSRLQSPVLWGLRECKVPYQPLRDFVVRVLLQWNIYQSDSFSAVFIWLHILYLGVVVRVIFLFFTFVRRLRRVSSRVLRSSLLPRCPPPPRRNSYPDLRKRVVTELQHVGKYWMSVANCSELVS